MIHLGKSIIKKKERNVLVTIYPTPFLRCEWKYKLDFSNEFRYCCTESGGKNSKVVNLLINC